VRRRLVRRPAGARRERARSRPQAVRAPLTEGGRVTDRTFRGGPSQHQRLEIFSRRARIHEPRLVAETETAVVFGFAEHDTAVRATFAQRTESGIDQRRADSPALP